MKHLIFGLLAVIVLSGCLTTRAELHEQEQKQVMQDQVTTMQQSHAQDLIRQQEYDEHLRALNGRLDQIENRIAQVQTGSAKEQEAIGHLREENAQKFKAFEEALVKLEGQVTALNEEVENLKKPKAPVTAKADAANSKKSTMQDADAAFEGKDWKGAIVLYQKYRDRNPKGKKFGEATLRIGECFRELGMKGEAKTFLEEVIEKFPGSPEAKKAKSLLKAAK